MYRINDETGKHLYLKNWNYLIQTELNVICHYLEESETAYSKYSKSPLKPFLPIDMDSVSEENSHLYENLFGANIDNLNVGFIYNNIFPSYLRNSIFLLIISLMETKVEKLCEHFHEFLVTKSQEKVDSPNLYFEEKKRNSKKGHYSKIKARKEYLKEVCGLTFHEELKKQWTIILDLYWLRNEIIHNYDEFETKKWKEKKITSINNYFSGLIKAKKIREVVQQDVFQYITLDNGSSDKMKTVVFRESFLSENLISFFKGFATDLNATLQKKIASKK